MAKLTKAERDRARERAAHAALLSFHRRIHVHYTQGTRRWNGITARKNAHKGEFPFFADCSAFTTWCLWNGLWLSHRKLDVVNGLNWKGGFTGTQILHGRKIKAGAMMPGDLVFYASRGQTPTHVAICVGRKGDHPYVISHGQESGPLFLRYDYRRVVQVRRFIHDGV